MSVKSSLICAAFLILFSSHAIAEHADPMGTSEFTARSKSGASYHLQIASSPIQTMQAQDATFTATSQDGAPISGAKISCTLKMPSMAMAKNTPSIKETTQAGTYKSVLLFTMGGDWTANCTAKYDNQVSETFAFEINDVPHGKMADGKHDMNKMLSEKDKHNMDNM